jgi:glycosyltransferase involved in cell wall biosynthesis
VVATPVGAIPEVIDDGCNGLLVPVGDADRLAEAIAGLVADETERCRLGAAAYRTVVQCYDFEQVVRRLEALYQAVGSAQVPARRPFATAGVE